uniref:Hexamerin-like protein 2 n=1 Tax=Haplotropis brunneriana TaxID=244722 RepID=A0A2I6SDC2_9ORTH|nr:hexamerin-like protein 2 [Haplotropis brunneriana]
MRPVIVVVFSLLVCRAVHSVVPHAEADIVLLTKQQKVLRLLYHVQQPTIIKEEQEIAKTYKPIEHPDNYQDKWSVEIFWKYYTHYGFLPRGEVFSIYYEKHLYQAKALFELMYYAKDFDSFYQTAVWAREYMNEAMFVYAFTIAVLHREDTKEITLPAPYEIYPQLFVNADVIHKAYNIRLQGYVGSKEEPYVLYANSGGFPEANNQEELVSYLTEDVGFNSFFTYLHYSYPFWLKPKNYSMPDFADRGERFFFSLQQIVSRYSLERFANRLPDLESIDYNHPVLVGYYPELRLQNGREAPARPVGVHPRNIDLLHWEELKNYERRIRDAIDYGYVAGSDYEKYNLREKDLTNILGNIVEGNAESIHREYYGSVYRNLLSVFSHIVDPVHQYGVPASVLEQPETQLRDPLFYRIAKRILSIFYQYKDHLKPYTQQELLFPGVTIADVTFDKLITYFDYFDFELNNALDLPNREEGAKYNFVARRYLLNHKPFFYYIKVKSEKEVNSLVRVYIGPKYDVYGRKLTLEERRHHYVLMDMFPKKLVPGLNEIKRSPKDFVAYGKEAPHFSELYNATERALKGEQKFFLDEFRSQFGFPHRLALPRGTDSGLPLSIFVIITPAVEGAKFPVATYTDNRALGFPFDRRIIEFEYEVPNAHFHDIYVVHRRLEDISATVADLHLGHTVKHVKVTVINNKVQIQYS